MPRRVYISCGFDERDLPQVRLLCSFLRISNCVIEFAPQPAGWSFYRNVEDAIDRCDAIIAVFGQARSCSTWLAHELHYAGDLNRVRFHPRPRLFGIKIDDFQEPSITKHVTVEWLDGTAETNQLLLQDLPDRG